jgi:hypothetical protein
MSYFEMGRIALEEQYLWTSDVVFYTATAHSSISTLL